MTRYCECGCGQAVNNRFVRGHVWCGRHLPIETRRKLSLSTESSWRDPKIRKRRADQIKESLRDPEVRKRKSWGHKRAWQNKETRERFSVGIKRAWQNPETRERHSVGLKKAFQNPEAKKKLSDRSKKFWQDPEIRNKLVAGMKRAWQNPDVRRKILDGVKRSWQDTEIRERRCKANRLAWERRETRTPSKEVREKISVATKKAMWKPETRARYLKAIKRVFKEHPELPSLGGKAMNKKYGGWYGLHKIFAKKNPSAYRELSKKRMIAMKIKPNKPEKKLIQLIAENNLPYRYCGDGDVVIGGKCPDFINYNGAKKLVELFGIYWHGNFPDETQRRILEAKRAEHFAKYGFSTLIIWEDELDNLEGVVEKMKNFTGAVV